MEAINEQQISARTARREEWRRVVAEQTASGKTITAFCREHGHPQWKFHYWRKALTPVTKSPDTNGFVQLQMKATKEPGTQIWLEAGTWRVCIAPGFDGETLQRVLTAVARI